MFNATITVFNRMERDGELLWYPTVMHDVHLEESEAAVAAKYGYQRGDKALVLIPYLGGPDEPSVGVKNYLTPKRWKKAEDPASAFTFQSGTDFDFFMTGKWEGPFPVRDADYPGGFYDRMQNQFDHVWAITGAEKFRMIPHFEVTGR